MTLKTYVLDTSVLLSSGRQALYSFPNSNVVIPLVVLEEVESKRSDPNLGLASRSILRTLDELRKLGDIKTGVEFGDNCKLRIEVNHTSNIPEVLTKYKTNDARIISVAHALDEELDGEVVLSSKDLAQKIIADLAGVKTEDFIPLDVINDYIDKLTVEIVADELIEQIHAEGWVRLDLDIPVNVAVNLRSASDPKKTALAIAGTQFKFTLAKPQKVFRLDPRGAEQGIATHYLMDKDIKIVSLGGKAGTGKTSLALAAGLSQVSDGAYDKVTVFRSTHAVGGEDLGHLPGTESEKMDPWTKAVWDSLYSFLDASQINYYKQHGMIEVLPLTHIRGRNLSKRFIIIDESQNLSRETLMTALSRAGQGTKAVMSWDVSQRDNLRVGRYDGVYEVASRLLGEKLFAHVSLQKSQRSDVAELVSNKLDDYGL